MKEVMLMKTGKFGLSFIMVSILAFVLGFFGFTEILVLVLGFGVIAERDKWLTKQTLQALYLRLSYSITIMVLGWVFTAFSWLFGIFKAYNAVTVISDIQAVINTVLYIGLFALSVFAVLNLFKGKDASVPLISKLADYTLNNVPIKTNITPNNAPYDVAQGAQWQNQPQQQAPQTQAPMPVQATVTQPSEVEVNESPVGNEEVKDDGSWMCSCGQRNDGNFCVMCGSSKDI